MHSKTNARILKVYKELNERQLGIQEVIYFEAKINYTILYTSGGAFTTSRTLKSFEEMLSRQVFLRIHKSYMVNSAFIASASFAASSGAIILKDGKSLEIARRRINQIREKVKSLNIN